jgi:predicted transcriptional regulator
MKAIIEVAERGSIFTAAAQQISEARQGHGPDYRLGFESAKSLFNELTPERLDLLGMLSRKGACRVEDLAETSGGRPETVAADVNRLVELGLVERRTNGTIWVPFDAIEILLPLARVA